MSRRDPLIEFLQIPFTSKMVHQKIVVSGHTYVLDKSDWGTKHIFAQVL